jgi:hypothetical protein
MTMIVSPDTGAPVTPSKQSLQHSPPSYWGSVDRMAAEGTLGLARRYMQQYDRLDTRFANLHASHTWLSAQASKEAAYLRVAYVQVLAPYLCQRGFDTELLHWCEDALEACNQLCQNHGWLLLLRGEAHNASGHWNEAIESFQLAITAIANNDAHTRSRYCGLGKYSLTRGTISKLWQH